MSVNASRPWLSPSSQKAKAKARNRPSLVSRQKRRKNRPARMKPIVIAPARKSSRVIASILLAVPNEAEQQQSDRRQGEREPRQAQVHLANDQHVEHDDEVVGGKEDEAEPAPQQQPHAGAAI